MYHHAQNNTCVKTATEMATERIIHAAEIRSRWSKKVIRRIVWGTNQFSEYRNGVITSRNGHKVRPPPAEVLCLKYCRAVAASSSRRCRCGAVYNALAGNRSCAARAVAGRIRRNARHAIILLHCWHCRDSGRRPAASFLPHGQKSSVRHMETRLWR